MTTATIAVKGSASDDFPADYATVFFGHEFNAPARSEVPPAGGNAVIPKCATRLRAWEPACAR